MEADFGEFGEIAFLDGPHETIKHAGATRVFVNQLKPVSEITDRRVQVRVPRMNHVLLDDVGTGDQSGKECAKDLVGDLS
jgi:hypothetical protein